MMKSPIEIRLDVPSTTGYVRYRRLADEERVSLSEREGDDVIVDYDRDRAVIGIELLAFDSSTLDVARSIAHGRGLAFPKDLAAAISLT